MNATTPNRATAPDRAAATQDRGTGPDRGATLVSLGIPLLIALSYGLLALSRDLRLSPLLPAVAGLVVALLGATLAAAKRRAPRWQPWLVLTLAIAFRLLFLFRPPELSDDLYRYVWDGGATLRGQNPYALAPAQVDVTTPAVGLLRAKVNHPELVTIYPPAAQLVFAAGRALGGGVLGMKALLVAFDLAACLVLLRLLRSAGLPVWRLALYAWHPLPVLELAGSGHVDGAAVLFSLLAVLALVRPSRARTMASPSADMTVGATERGFGGAATGATEDGTAGAAARGAASVAAGVGAGAAFAAAVLTKFFPLVWLPAVLGLGDRRKSIPFLAGAAATAAVLTAVFLPDIGNMVSTLSTYARNWEFAGFAFRSLRHAIGSGDVSRLVLAGGFLVSCFVLYGARDERSRLQPALCRGYTVVLAFLLLTPTLHPWYALYLAALLPFAAGPFGLALSGSVFLGYRVLARYVTEGQWIDSDATAAAIVAVPVAVFLLKVLVARRSARRSVLAVESEQPPGQ